MADQPDPKNLLPSLVAQNPSPDETDSQDRMNSVRSQVDRIMSVFTQILPSNYVAKVPGPSYTLQFQALAEQIASFQITAQEVFADSSFEYTRTEFLYQLLGALVFPDAELQGYPEIPGDLSYREFLRRMVVLLLQGSTATTIKEGVELLTDADVEVIERGVVARALKGKSAWGEDEKHTIEINVSASGVPYTVASGTLVFNGVASVISTVPAGVLTTTDYTVSYSPPDSTVLQTTEKTLTSFKAVAPYVYGTVADPISVPYDVQVADSAFPTEPFRLQSNVHLVLRALKPAHVIYDYRHLLRETFGDLLTASVSFAFQDYHYQDLRRYWEGAKLVGGPDSPLDPPGRRQVGLYGVTHTDRTLFSDPHISFWSIRPGTVLTILSGPNSLVASPTDEGWVGRYRVLEVKAFPTDEDTTARAYTTAPTGLSGFATVSGTDITDPLQDWSLAEEGEILTFATGPNAGSYRLDTVLGNNGGPLGAYRRVIGPSTSVRVAPGILRVYPRMARAVTDQEYEVAVDRLGVQLTQYVFQEDVSDQFRP